MQNSIYDFTVTDIQGNPLSMGNFKGKVLLIVNTASQCGFTPQYKALEELYQAYSAKGFTVLGFPCNQFGAQEKENEAKISQFCELNFGVTFPLFSKVDVNGADAAPLYQYLKHSAKGLLGTEAIKWNFTKFLVDGNGNVLERFAPTTKPESLAPKIAALLS
ncbi:glutathione peroxidase [Shewanella sp. SR44-3]|uniref:glutathione peroxidase n=1 Tax=unclassified Shewanella TaxID=196818 RepID=UPI0015F9F3B5|nr:glutathione peroxidase [Shewanella sp. SR44-3]MBB1269874.1 glutathione peroxidase [Shewanella sp. SR44-3]